tara:strand:+ start:865 stop:1578 length:714 start_codon:yes stop_codon:yes gene_type:complete
MIITKEAPMKAKSHTINTQQALAVAFMADRLNKGYVKETRRFSEDVPTTFANKEIVKFFFAEQDNFTPEDYVKAIPTDEDFDSVDIALNHFKRYSMEILGDKLNDFQKDIFNCVGGEVISRNKLGVVSYVPELVRREVEEAKLKKLLRTEYRNSQPVGKQFGAVTGNLKILSRTYSQNWDSYNYLADMAGNIVSFMKKDKFEVGKRFNFKAKVKQHQKNKLFDGIDETRLNYIRKTK